MSIDIKNVRNIGIIAHIDAGKTTVTERMLFYSGFTHRVGEVDQGTTLTDFYPEEQERGITIRSAAVTFPWHKHQINLIDTPGHVDFTAEVERCLRVLDGGVVIFSAREGVEAQSETVWHQADHYKVPRIAFINKMDREGAEFYETVDEIRERLAANPLVLEIPVGAGPAHLNDPFSGVIDLLRMQMVRFETEEGSKGNGTKIVVEPIPEQMQAKAKEFHAAMLDELSLHDDELMETLLMEEEPEVDKLIAVIRKATLDRRVVPLLCGSGKDGVGIQPLLDAVVSYLPSPVDVPPVEGEDLSPKKKKDDDKPATRKPSVKEPFCGLVFKIAADKHGDLFYVRIYSGKLKANSRVLNAGKNEKENVPQLWKIQCDRREQVPEAEAGDIVGIVGLRHSVTGDTLCDPKAPILLESIHFPETVISMAIEPENSVERKKLAAALDMMRRQDPTFGVKESEETGQTLISGMGELHLEVIKHSLLREHKLNVRVHNPRVTYRETILSPVTVTGECHRTIAGKSLFAKIDICMEPQKTGGPPIVVPDCGDALPPEFMQAAFEVLGELGQGGGMFGYPLMDMKVTLTGGEFSETDSNELAFRIAAGDAFDRGLREAEIGLLEPIMKIEVATPEDYLGEIMSDLQQRRALITRTHNRGKVTLVDAEAPLINLFGYSSAMRGLSQGRATCSMEPLSYGPAPPEVMKGFMG